MQYRCSNLRIWPSVLPVIGGGVCAKISLDRLGVENEVVGDFFWYLGARFCQSCTVSKKYQWQKPKREWFLSNSESLDPIWRFYQYDVAKSCLVYPIIYYYRQKVATRKRKKKRSTRGSRSHPVHFVGLA